MPGHKDPEYEVLHDKKGLAYIKIIRGKPVKEQPKQEAKVVDPEPKIQVYKVNELWDMLKAEQVDLLKLYGLSNLKIKLLNTEDKRVEKILDLQDDV